MHNAEMEHYMSAKSILRTRYRNGFRVNQELGMPYHLYCGLKATLMALPYGVFVSSLGPNWSWWGLLSGSLLWLFFCFNFEIYVYQHIQTRTLAVMRISKGQWLTRLGRTVLICGVFVYLYIFYIAAP
ncbi:hypothetical protein DBQ68_13230 [Lactobacillus sp. DS15_6]|nr:hypothetical protein Lpp43_08308 [Lacticaseibacillus paracasei subsp. paracasei Lpp43]EPD03429.1 hypothetical protein Lpp78_13520 [Lacticaseibacillus paracasei subsp. paracasei CNCM I-2877]MCT3377295.1 hypothetical protein [Lacticaseibacillus paracasei]PTS48490.1 hypothetical protein DBQ62_13020 [Lactobacillus sp. DS9_6]PTS60418.1 hypothetical protein DBQ68_13230 [Lactobacillus sp. DS15_6]PTS68509.1 hypothetical protein DBQ65_13305 [Lactobacillus sp. DS3_6]PTV38800.1 hypothetical protein D